jgi:hypothetical protein
MTTVMLDNDITGFRDLLVGTLRTTGWHEYGLVKFVTMREAGLDSNSNDRQVWRFCQREGFILLTGNRNDEDDTSLARTLREENSADSLPVVTVANKNRLYETGYRENCIYGLMDIVLELNRYLGTGRQFIH